LTSRWNGKRPSEPTWLPTGRRPGPYDPHVGPTEDPWVSALAAFKTYIEAAANETEARWPTPRWQNLRIHDTVMNDPDAHERQSKQLYEEVFGRGDYDAADDVLTEDHVSHGPGSPPVIGSADIKRQARLLHMAFSEFRVELLDQLAEGDRVASR
jgi:hypothetical protein